MKFTICHDTSKKTLAIPGPPSSSRTGGRGATGLHTEHGCIVLTRQGALQGAAGCHPGALRSEHRHGCPLGSGQPVSQRYAVQKERQVFRPMTRGFLDMLEHCGVDLFGLGALLTREEDAE